MSHFSQDFSGFSTKLLGPRRALSLGQTRTVNHPPSIVSMVPGLLTA
jgi:hypothetical protein